MKFVTGLTGMVGRAAALVLLAVSLAKPGAVSAQGTGAGATPDPAKEGQARLCVNAYNGLLKADSRFVADNRAAIETRRQALSKKFGIAAPAITPDGSRIGEFLADFTSAQISDCENQFADMPAFQPRIHAGYGLLMAPAAPTPPAPAPAPLSDLACATAYWLNGAAFPQDREMVRPRYNHALQRHLAANPGEDGQATQQRIIAAGQARGQRIQSGAESVDGLRGDIANCERKYGFEAQAAAAPAPPPAPPKGLAETAGGGLRVVSASDNGMFMIAGSAPIRAPLGPIKVWTWFFPRTLQNDGVQDYDAMAIQMEINCGSGTLRGVYYEPYLGGEVGKGGASDEPATKVQPGTSQFNIRLAACDILYDSGLDELLGTEPLPDHRAGRAAADSWLRILYGDK